MNKLDQFIIPETENNSRLDRCIRRNLGYINQSLLEKSLRNKLILLNGKKAKASDKIEKKQIISYEKSLFSSNKKNELVLSKAKINYYLDLYKKIKIKENKNLVVLNKPNKIAVQGGTGQNLYIDELLKVVSNEDKLKLVHRLDKDTSGILLIAKNLKTTQSLNYSFKNNEVQKLYLAIVSPVPNKLEGYITSKIEKNKFVQSRKMKISDTNGKYAKTYFKTLVKNLNFALVCLYPITGRTHQLRVHMNQINCSIVGDKKYSLNDSYKEEDNFLKLHSYMMKIPNVIQIKAPLPEHFINFINEKNLNFELKIIEKDFVKDFNYE